MGERVCDLCKLKHPYPGLPLDCIAALRDELRRVKGELAARIEDNKWAGKQLTEACRERDEAREALKAEVERLRDEAEEAHQESVRTIARLTRERDMLASAVADVGELIAITRCERDEAVEAAKSMLRWHRCKCTACHSAAAVVKDADGR